MGGTRIFWGSQRGDQNFFSGSKEGDQNFLKVKEWGTKIFSENFFVPSAQFLLRYRRQRGDQNFSP